MHNFIFSCEIDKNITICEAKGCFVERDRETEYVVLWGRQEWCAFYRLMMAGSYNLM